MGSERRQTLKVRQWNAVRGKESAVFKSRREALEWLGSRGVPTPLNIAIEDYELKHDHVPKAHENPDDPDDWTGIRLYEALFAVYGTATPEEPIDRVEERLRHKASARRRNSYERRVIHLTPEVLKAQRTSDMPESARRFAREVWATVGDREEEAGDRFLEKERIAGLPKVKDLHKLAVAEDLRVGRISPGTAHNAGSIASSWLKLVGDRRIDQVTSTDFSVWLKGAMGSGSKSALRNAIGEIQRIYKHLRRDDDLAVYAAPFVTTTLSAHLSGVVMTDGARRAVPMTPEEVEQVIRACETDGERAAVGLALLGIRSLGEVCAVRWSDLSEDLDAHWLQVSQTAVDLEGGRVILEQPKDVKKRKRNNGMTYRHYPITARLLSLIEPMRGRGEFVLSDFAELQSDKETGVPNPARLGRRVLIPLLARAGITRANITPYSFRHTVLDATEEYAGREFRDLLHRGDDDKSVANRTYTHADARRFRRRLFLREGVTCGDVMPWAH